MSKISPSEINDLVNEKLDTLTESSSKILKSMRKEISKYQFMLAGSMAFSLFFLDKSELFKSDNLTDLFKNLLIGASILTVIATNEKLNAQDKIEKSLLEKRRFENKLIDELGISREEFDKLPTETRKKFINENLTSDFVKEAMFVVEREVENFLKEERRDVGMFEKMTNRFKQAIATQVFNYSMCVDETKLNDYLTEKTKRIDSFRKNPLYR